MEATQRPAAAPAVNEPPPLRVLRMGLGYQVTALIALAARLGIADLLADGPRSAAELAKATGAHPQALLRFLRACTAYGLCEIAGPDSFVLTPEGMCLRSDAQSLHGFALGMGQPGHLRPFEHLYEGIMENRSVAQDALGMPMWEYYDAHPEAKATLTEHLDEVTAELAPHVASKVDFTDFNRIVDVGGNQGHFLSAILEAAPKASGILFDRPEVMEDARETMAARGLTDRVELVGGDFLEWVPGGGDLYLIKGVLHDWDDDGATRILSNCHQAAAPGSRLLSLEGIVRSEPPLDQIVHLIDLSMLLLVGGRERTRGEFDALFGGAGYRITETIALPTLGYFPYHIILAERQ
ncbi:MAG: methyltransferase [Nocardiopsaceae bacterium]|nr:methyltransferase [Nocardiopsaceae bacterium]